MDRKPRTNLIYKLISLSMIIFLMAFFLLPADQTIFAAENQESTEENGSISGMGQPDQEELDNSESDDDINDEELNPETGSEEMETESSSQEEIRDVEEATEAEEVTEETRDDSSDDSISDGDVTSDQKPEEDNDPEVTDEADEKNDVVINFDKIISKIRRQPGPNKISAKSSYMPLLYGNISNDACKITLTGNDKSFTLQGTVNSAYCLGEVYVDGTNTANRVYNFNYATKTIKTPSINLSKFGTGYHTIMILVYTNKTTKTVQDALYQGYVPYNGITAKPTYNGVFNVNSTSFSYYPYNMALSNQEGKLFMEYSANGGKSWKRTGYMQANLIKLYTQQGFSFGGLKPNTVYRTRIRYGEYTDYLEKSYLFVGPVKNTTTFKTGKAKAPKIKSVKIKAIKVKRHKHRVAGHYEWTGYHYVWIGPYTEKYYTCKFKLTIKLKKKPGAKGIWVDGTFLKGNKKKYTKIITPTYNYYIKKPPKGLKKVKVSIKTYQSTSYGGYSPAKTKKVKIK